MKLTEVKKILGKLPESKRQLAMAVYDKAVWQNAELERLQGIINERGWVEDYRNGEHQTGRKKSAEADTYLSLAKVFNTTTKQLNDMIAEVASESQDDELMTFMKGKNRIRIHRSHQDCQEQNQ